MLPRLRALSTAFNMSTPQITLYSAKICPYAHRAELALEEIKAQYQRFEVNLKEKPVWYAPKVNPASKVPAVTYGGPQVAPDQPSPESIKLNESLVLLDFFTDIDPEHRLLPKDPIERARVRLFIDAVTNKLVPKWYNAAIKGEDASSILEGIEAISALLSPDAKFAVGNEYTIADAAALPFFARAEVSLKHDVGAFPAGSGTKAYQTLQNDEKFALFRRYYSALTERESFKKTFDAEHTRQYYVERFTPLRQTAKVA
jgi:glutathione S-transferase